VEVEVLMTAYEQAVDPHGWHRLVERDGVRSLEEGAQYDVCLEASEGGTDAVVDATSERDMAFEDAPLEVDVVGVVAAIGVTVGRTPERDHGGSGGNGDSAESGVPRNGPELVAERGLKPQ
jgi:hypothetical protein